MHSTLNQGSERPPGSLTLAGVKRLIPAAATMVLLLAAVLLRCVVAANIGAFWRDEVNTLNIVASPTISSMGRMLEFDSFPIGYFLLLRGWAAVFGATIGSVRTLDLIIALGTMASLFLHARVIGCRLPLLSLFLLGLCFTAAYWGGTNRAWGLGMLTVTLFYTAFTRGLDRPTPGWTAVTAVAGVFAAQSVYYNSLIIGSVCAAAVVDCAVRKRWRVLPYVIAAGIPALLSDLPYLSLFRHAATWNVMIKATGVDVSWIYSKLTGALPNVSFVWLALTAIAAIIALYIAFARQFRQSAEMRWTAAAREDVLFHGLCLPFTIALYFAFLIKLSYPTQPWYFITLLTLLALSIESVLMPLLTSMSAQTVLRFISAAAIVGTACLFPALVGSGSTHLTTMDAVARFLTETARPDDLIVVNQWEWGVSFAHYYNGKTPWTTLPPLPDHSLHRYDLVKLAVMDPADALNPVYDAASKCLARGGTVYVVGMVYKVNPAQPPPVLRPAPDPVKGWDTYSYYLGWRLQFADYLHQQGAHLIGVTDSGVLTPTTGLEASTIFAFSRTQPTQSPGG